MENRGSVDDVDDVFKDSVGNHDEKKTWAGSALAARPADLRKANIKKDGFLAEEFPADLPSIAMPSTKSESSPCASLPVPPASTPKVNKGYGRNVAHGIGRRTKKLDHAPPSEPMSSATGQDMVDSCDTPPSVFVSNHEVAPGAFAVVSSSHNTATSRTSSYPTSSYVSTREFTNDSYTGSRPSGLYAVEAQLVPDENEEGTTIVAEAKPLSMKWYQRPLFRWMLACGLVGVVVVTVVLVVRPKPAATVAPPHRHRPPCHRNKLPVTFSPF